MYVQMIGWLAVGWYRILPGSISPARFYQHRCTNGGIDNKCTLAIDSRSANRYDYPAIEGTSFALARVYCTF